MPANPPSLFSKIIQRLQSARFLSISLVIHLILGVFLGGVVLFKAVQEKEVFVSTSGETFLASSDEGDGAGDAETVTEFEEPSAGPSAEATDAPSLMQTSAIASLTDSKASFEVTGFSQTQTAGAVFASTAMGSLSGAASSNAAGAASGVRGKLGGGSFFGAAFSEGAQGLIGSFYDLKQDRNRKPTGMTPAKYGEVVLDFARSWRESKLRDYYKAPGSLVASQIFMPNMKADLGPKAFGAEKEVQPSMWIAVYRAKVSPPKSGTFHFVGAGDDVLFVRFNGKTVLERCWYLRPELAKTVANYDYGFSKIRDGFAKGAAFQAEAGKFYEIEVLIGEQPGGFFFATLLLEEKGVSYAKDGRGNPILPVFRVADTQAPPLEPGQTLPPYAKDGPVWSVQTLATKKD